MRGNLLRMVTANRRIDVTDRVLEEMFPPTGPDTSTLKGFMEVFAACQARERPEERVETEEAARRWCRENGLECQWVYEGGARRLRVRRRE